jgi:poly(beta-D-mannuronate) lyase
MEIDRRNKIYKVTRRGFMLVALAGVAELIYLKERSHQLPKFVPIFVKPSQVLDLTTWKINLPIRNQQVTQPDLSAFYDDAFKVVQAVQFTVMCDGQAQPGSAYPRSELREMNVDGSQASWSTTSGVHRMDLTQRITHLPVVKPQLVCGQIHSDTEYLILVEVDSNKLYVRYKDDVAGVLDKDYQLGTYFNMTIQAAQGYVDVFYNGAHMVHQALDADGCYFKAGCYLQSNTSRGDQPTAYGQVEICKLAISHS